MELRNRTINREEKDAYEIKSGVIKLRFPNAKFSISCFQTLDEIENKVLNDTDEFIIFNDSYTLKNWDKKTESWKLEKTHNDNFLVQRKPNEKCIYYKDVIDRLCECEFERNCDHRYMENIRQHNSEQRNQKSIKTYGTFWGS